MDPTDTQIQGPSEPESLEETGLADSLVEHLILKILYFRGDMYGQDLSTAIGFKFSLIHDLVEGLKLRHDLQVKRSLGMGSVGALLSLTESGRSRARNCLESNQYAGPAPVPLDQYAEIVRRQRPMEGWVTKEGLLHAFRGMVVTEKLISQVGPAVSAANSLLLYGQPGDGKTFLVESLNNLETTPIFLPHALECQGNIVQLFDPIYHHRLPEETRSLTAVAAERSYDHRWIRCKRPFIVSGGELTLDMLDLRYNQASKVYEAPFQLKANNGIYLIDDFGRQRATPAEVLNRWIVPMERRQDYLSFHSGGKMTVPFEAFLVFSSNLKPESLGDEAFLRRIQYKMLLPGPAENEFIRIFERVCEARKVDLPRQALDKFLEKRFRRAGKPYRRCHPRDVMTHAVNLLQFEKQPLQLSEEILDRAFESCFIQEEDPASMPVLASSIVQVSALSCSHYWDEKMARVPTLFGRLAFVASYRDPETGKYQDPRAALDHTEREISVALAQLHHRIFREWIDQTPGFQCADLKKYLSKESGRAVFASFERSELEELLAPRDAKAEARQSFADAFAAVCEAVAMEAEEAACDPAAVAAEESAHEEGAIAVVEDSAAEKDVTADEGCVVEASMAGGAA